MNVTQIPERNGKTQTRLQLTRIELLMVIAWAAQRLGSNHAGPLPLRDLSGNGWIFEWRESNE